MTTIKSLHEIQRVFVQTWIPLMTMFENLPHCEMFLEQDLSGLSVNLYFCAILSLINTALVTLLITKIRVIPLQLLQSEKSHFFCFCREIFCWEIYTLI